MSETKTYARTCKRCGGEYRVYRPIRAPGVCGDMACLTAEADEHNAAVAAHRAELAERRRNRPWRARVKREPVMTELSMAFQLGAMSQGKRLR